MIFELPIIHQTLMEQIGMAVNFICRLFNVEFPVSDKSLGGHHHDRKQNTYYHP